MLIGQQPQPGVLNRVGVLEFIHQDMAETALVVAAQVIVVAKQLQHPQQHFIEVHQTGALTGFLIGQIDLLHGRGEQITAADIHVRRAQPFVLLAVNEPGGLARRPALLIQP